MRENILKSKSYTFALRIVKMYKYLCSNKEYVLSKQVLRSGTAIGALVSEYENGHRGAVEVAYIKHQDSKTKSMNSEKRRVKNDGLYCKAIPTIIIHYSLFIIN